MPQKADISIIIVSCNSLETLQDCLGSIIRQGSVSHETIVVDNDSRDGTSKFLENQNVLAVLQSKNLGFGAAANIGAFRANGKYLLILNPDTLLPPGALKTLYDFAESNPECGLISPLLTDPDGKIQKSARVIPRRRDFIFGRGSPLFKLGFSKEKDGGYLSGSGDEPINVPTVSATALFLKKSLFEKLGGFDERYFMYLEDIDLCRRAGESGHSIWLLPQARVSHIWRTSTRKRPYFASFHHHLSVFRYFNKFYPRQIVYNFCMALALLVGFMVSSLLTLFRIRERA